MSRSGYIVDYDLDRERRLSEIEKRTLKKGVFDCLKNYGYMIHIDIDGIPFKVRFVNDFEPKIEGDRMIYRFFVP